MQTSLVWSTDVVWGLGNERDLREDEGKKRRNRDEGDIEGKCASLERGFIGNY